MKILEYKSIKALFSAFFWLIVWAVLAAVINKPLLLPSPMAVLKALAALICTADYWRFTILSLLRIIAGIVSGILAGLALVVLTSRFALAETLFSPVITIIKSTPVASFVVLVLVWIERDYVPILISALMVMPVIWANVSAGIKNTDAQLLEMAHAYALPRTVKLWKIYIPSVMPYFRSACSSVLGFGWKAGIAAEVLTVPRRSIGRMIYESKLYLQTTSLFAWTINVIILSLCLEKLVLRFIVNPDSKR